MTGRSFTIAISFAPIFATVLATSPCWRQTAPAVSSLDLSSKSAAVRALVGAQKVSAASMNEALPKPKPIKKKAIKKAEKKNASPKRVGIVFDGKPAAPETRPSTEKFFAQMNMSKAGRADLPNTEEDATVANTEAKPVVKVLEKTVAPQVVINNTYERPRRPVYDAYENDPTGYESNSVRTTVRTRERSRSAGSNVAIIPTGGLSYSQIDLRGQVVSDDYQNREVKGRTGFMTGVLLEVGRGDFSFQTGLVYMQEGAKLANSGIGTDGVTRSVDADVQVHYVGLPLLAKLNTGSAGSTRFSLKGGIIPAFATNIDTQEKQTASYYGQSASGSYNGSTQEGLRRWNVIGQLGAGISVPMNEALDFRFDLLYNRAFLSMLEGENGIGDAYTQSFMGVVGLGISL